MDDEKPLELRDQLALSILNGLLSNSSSTTVRDDVANIVGYTIHQDEKIKKFGILSAERLIRISYTMADMIRKIRLSVFE